MTAAPTTGKTPARRRRSSASPSAATTTPEAQATGTAPEPINPADFRHEVNVDPTLDSLRGLHVKIAEVIGAVQRIPKTGWNSHQNYAFSRESDVVAAISGELAARHLDVAMSIATIESLDTQPMTTSQGKPTTGYRLWFAVEIIDGDNPDDRWSTLWPGESQDTADKGLPKAMTMAKKTFLINRFLLSTGDDTEGSASSNEETGGYAHSSGGRQAPADRSASPPPQPTETPEEHRQRAMRALFAKARELGVETEPTLRTVLRIATVTDERPIGVGSFRDADTATLERLAAMIEDMHRNPKSAAEYIAQWRVEHPEAVELDEKNAAAQTASTTGTAPTEPPAESSDEPDPAAEAMEGPPPASDDDADAEVERLAALAAEHEADIAAGEQGTLAG